MARWSYLILVVYIVLAVNAQGKDETTTTEPETTTPKPTTTTSATTSTTTKSTSTSTTTAKTTTPATQNTTTPTTPAPPVTTTAPPEPKYPKNVGHWFLNTTDNKATCLVLDAAFEVKVTMKNDSAEISVPRTANLSGTCDEDSIVAKLTWPSEEEKKENELTMTFGKKGSDFMVNEVALLVYYNNETVDVPGVNQSLFQTPLNRSYKCNAESPVKLDDKVVLKIASMRVEPFRTTPFSGFSKEYECSSDDVSTVVPFAVGISLALLVVIVLVAYLIGRRRSRARGYQSV